MTRKKPVKATETRADVIDKIFAQVDPEVLLAGALGAIATMGGITPPLTRVLMAVGGNTDLGNDFLNDAANTWYSAQKYGSPLLFALGLSFGEEGGTQDKSVKATGQAIAAAGALEAMMMMSFAKNPNAMSALASLVPTKVL